MSNQKSILIFIFRSQRWSLLNEAHSLPFFMEGRWTTLYSSLSFHLIRFFFKESGVRVRKGWAERGEREIKSSAWLWLERQYLLWNTVIMILTQIPWHSVSLWRPFRLWVMSALLFPPLVISGDWRAEHTHSESVRNLQRLCEVAALCGELKKSLEAEFQCNTTFRIPL